MTAFSEGRAALVATYGSLAVFYFGSLIVTFSYVSPRLIFDPAARVLATSVFARFAGGTLCMLVLASVLLGRPRANVGRALAWLLVGGVVFFAVMDAVLPTAPLQIWAIAGAAISLHVYGALLLQRDSRHGAF